MKSNSTNILLFFAIASLVIGELVANAQQLSSEAPARPLKITEPVNRRYGAFNIDFEYWEKDAWLGNDLQVKVTINSISDKNLKFIGFVDDDAKRTILRKTDELSQNVAEGPLLKAEYRYTLGIKQEATPQTYNIKLRFEAPDRDKHPDDQEYSDIFKTFPLNVGVRRLGLLSIQNSEDKPEPIVCTLGSQQDFYLPLTNNFPGYAVNIERIEVTSKPGDLIKHVVNTEPPGEINGNVISFDKPISIEPAQRQLLRIRLQMAGMSFSRLADGFFDDSHRVELAFVYNDGHNRRISDYIPRVDIKVKPGGSIWLLSMISGVLLGTTVKLLLERQKEPGKITKSVFTVTAIIGVIASALVWVGHIQIFVWNFRGSYDNPVIILLIGFAASYVGQSLLDMALKPGARASSPVSASRENH